MILAAKGLVKRWGTNADYVAVDGANSRSTRRRVRYNYRQVRLWKVDAVGNAGSLDPPKRGTSNH